MAEAVARPASPADRLLPGLGYLIPVLFWATIIGCGLALGDYDHLTRLVSELGARGMPTHAAFTAGLLGCGVMSAVFIAALRRKCVAAGASQLPVLILASFTISIIGAAIFPLPLRLHFYAGLPVVLLVASPLSSLVLWRGRAGMSGTRPYAVIGGGLLALAFLAFVPGVLPRHPGVMQRVAHLGWSIWFVGLGRGVR